MPRSLVAVSLAFFSFTVVAQKQRTQDALVHLNQIQVIDHVQSLVNLSLYPFNFRISYFLCLVLDFGTTPTYQPLRMARADAGSRS